LAARELLPVRRRVVLKSSDDQRNQESISLAAPGAIPKNRVLSEAGSQVLQRREDAHRKRHMQSQTHAVTGVTNEAIASARNSLRSPGNGDDDEREET
jgi:hypothetical protein